MQRVKKFLPISVAFLFGLFVLVGPSGQALAADSDGFDSSTLAVASADVQLAGKHSMKSGSDDANDPLESINPGDLQLQRVSAAESDPASGSPLS